MESLLSNKLLLSGLAVGIAVVVVKIFFGGSSKPKPKPAPPVLDPSEYKQFKLIEKKSLTKGELVQCPVNLYRFEITDNRPLGLPVGQHITLRAKVEDSPEPILRNYTPTSSNDDTGHFDLVIKVYPKGKMSQYVDKLKIGDSIDVCGPKGRFVYEKNKYRAIGMLAGGTGITPMLQIVTEILKHKDDTTEVSLLFGNLTVQDIILRDTIDDLTAKHKNFKVYHVLNEAPQDWTQGKGFITKDIIKERLPAPADDIIVLQCGPPPMMSAMQKNLLELGYDKKHIFSF